MNACTKLSDNPTSYPRFRNSRYSKLFMPQARSCLLIIARSGGWRSEWGGWGTIFKSSTVESGGGGHSSVMAKKGIFLQWQKKRGTIFTFCIVIPRRGGTPYKGYPFQAEGI